MHSNGASKPLKRSERLREIIGRWIAKVAIALAFIMVLSIVLCSQRVG
jgi:hypothetical protein